MMTKYILLFLFITSFRAQAQQYSDGIYLSNPKGSLTLALNDESQKKYTFDANPIVKLEDIESFRVKRTEYDIPAFVIKLKSEPEKKLKQITSANLKKSLGVVIKGVLILMPYIQEPIDRELLLRTNMTEDEAMELKKFVDKKITASKH